MLKTSEEILAYIKQFEVNAEDAFDKICSSNIPSAIRAERIAEINGKLSALALIKLYIQDIPAKLINQEVIDREYKCTWVETKEEQLLSPVKNELIVGKRYTGLGGIYTGITVKNDIDGQIYDLVLSIRDEEWIGTYNAMENLIVNHTDIGSPHYRDPIINDGMWRLPTIPELTQLREALFDIEGIEPTFLTDKFYWSQESLGDGTALAFEFIKGDVEKFGAYHRLYGRPIKYHRRNCN